MRITHVSRLAPLHILLAFLGPQILQVLVCLSRESSNGRIVNYAFHILVVGRNGPPACPLYAAIFRPAKAARGVVTPIVADPGPWEHQGELVQFLCSCRSGCASLFSAVHSPLSAHPQQFVLLLTLSSAHAQRGLRYLVCVYVCVCWVMYGEWEGKWKENG